MSSGKKDDNIDAISEKMTSMQLNASHELEDADTDKSNASTPIKRFRKKDLKLWNYVYDKIMELDHTNLPPTWPTVHLDLKEILALELYKPRSNQNDKGIQQSILNIIRKGYDTPGNNLYDIRSSDFFFLLLI